jgi:hypothetical protein
MIMCEYGDKIFSRLRRIIAGTEPVTQTGRRCARCKKDMSHYVLLFEPESTDICNECKTEIRKEEYLARRRAAKPPVYDIDQILFAPERKSYEIASELNSKIDPDCPESLLLAPELVVRDFEEFSCLEGHDFGNIIGLGNGPEVFLRGLRALKAIGATRLVECMSKMRDFAIQRGVPFPEPLPDPWFCDIRVDSELKQEFRRLTDELKPYQGLKGGDLPALLLKYLHSQLDLLRQRKPIIVSGRHTE